MRHIRAARGPRRRPRRLAGRNAFGADRSGLKFLGRRPVRGSNRFVESGRSLVRELCCRPDDVARGKAP